ncbi:MAG: hypothetical protein IKA05_06360, partial [Clostridia bacterium]|nr:hypothetical protein [Clostridia bacterium]
ASLLNLSNAQIAVAATDVRSKRYSRDALATILGPLPKMVHKIVFTWKFYVFTLTVLLGKKGPQRACTFYPIPRTSRAFFIAKLPALVRDR